MLMVFEVILGTLALDPPAMSGDEDSTGIVPDKLFNGYKLRTVKESIMGVSMSTAFHINSEKPENTWNKSKFPSMPRVQECAKGLAMVKQGVKQLIKSDKIERIGNNYFSFDANECGCAMEPGEWFLLGLSLLKRNGRVSTDGKDRFRITRTKADQSIRTVSVTQEGCDKAYVILAYGSTMILFEQFNERNPSHVAEPLHDNSPRAFQVINYTKIPEVIGHEYEMNIVDFATMFARREVLPYEERRETSSRVQAVLMGTHSRLGAKSPLFSFEQEIITMIAKNALSPVMREAVEAGVVRF